jgi:hypothetical protein
LLKLLAGTAGHFFSACFVKRSDGVERVIHCRTGVHPSDAPSVARIMEYHDILTVWDMQKQAFRSIPIEGILWIRLNGLFIRPSRDSDQRPLNLTTQGHLFAQTVAS